MSDPTKSPETPKSPEDPKKVQLNEKQIKLLATMAQNTVGKVEYNWDKIAAETGYKNVASVRSTYSRLCTFMGVGSSSSKSPSDKGESPVSSGPKNPTKVTKRTGKVGSSSAKKPRGKKGKAAAMTEAEGDSGDGDAQKEEQIEVKGEPEDENDGDAMMSGGL